MLITFSQTIAGYTALISDFGTSFQLLRCIHALTLISVLLIPIAYTIVRDEHIPALEA